MNKKQKSRIFICSLFVISLFLHLIFLGSLNPYLNADEASLQLSSWCLGNYRTDRYGNHLPVLIANFYGSQSAAYAYLVAPFVKIMGMNLWSIRLPMALAFSLAVFPLYHLLRFTEKEIRVFTILLYVFSPLMIAMGRLGLDCNLIVPASICMLDAIVTAIHSKRVAPYILASVASGFVLYTYAFSYLLIPVFLFFIFLALYRKKQIHGKQILAVFLTLGITAAPVLLEVLTLYGIKRNWNLGPISFIYIPRNTGGELTKINPLNLIHSISALIASDYAFNKEAGGYIFRTSQPFGRTYLNFFALSIPFFFFGFFECIRKAKEEWKEGKVGIHLVCLFHLCCGLILYGSMYYIMTYRISLLIPSALFMMGIGGAKFWKSKQKWIRLNIKLLYSLEFILFFFMFFFMNVSEHLADQRYSVANIPFKKELEFIQNKENCQGKEVYVISSSPGWIYIPISLGHFSPEEMEMARIDDTVQESENAFSFKGIHTEKPEFINKDAVYVVTKKYKIDYYDTELNFTGFEKKDFPYYTVYWNKN